MCVQMLSRRHSGSFSLYGGPNHMGPEREREKDPWGATAATAAAATVSRGTEDRRGVDIVPALSSMPLNEAEPHCTVLLSAACLLPFSGRSKGLSPSHRLSLPSLSVGVLVAPFFFRHHPPCSFHPLSIPPHLSLSLSMFSLFFLPPPLLYFL